MDDAIQISFLNDFIFCPASIYFHQLYGGMDDMLFQCSDQLNGKNAHAAIDEGRYSSKKNMLQAISVYCERYNILGKIDLFNIDTGMLTERKKKITVVYDGYIFQLYAQYFALQEMGYMVKSIKIYAVDSNKAYTVKLPENDPEMLIKFEETVERIKHFKLDTFRQENVQKCMHCIYEDACDRSLL